MKESVVMYRKKSYVLLIFLRAGGTHAAYGLISKEFSALSYIQSKAEFLYYSSLNQGVYEINE